MTASINTDLHDNMLTNQRGYIFSYITITQFQELMAETLSIAP